ncbi:MAG: hypothetical protein ACFFAJ_04980 [Candidatus Hodarchaeota archaeon]
MCNVGGLIKISNANINPNLFFDHQTIKSDVNDDDKLTQSEINDYQSDQSVKEIDGKKSKGIDEKKIKKNKKKSTSVESLPTSEWGCMDDLLVEQGWIIADGYYIDNPLPICLTQAEIDDWYLYMVSHGGYEPYDGYVVVEQKGEKHFIGIEWTHYGHYDCCYDVWLATFVVCEPICLDSSYYPYVDSWFGICEEGLIPGKDVDLKFIQKWTGCEPENNQDFTILSVEDLNHHQFPI